MKFAALAFAAVLGSAAASSPLAKSQDDLRAGFESLFTHGDWFPFANSTLPVTSGTTLVCDILAPYVPTSCGCQNTDAGGTLNCSVDAGGIETITVQVDVNVCASPATLRFYMVDEVGLEFEEVFEAGDTGEMPTGLLLGLPEVGDAEIYLAYTIDGSIDSLHLKFGFDLGATVFGFTTYCSSLYPSKCPIWVMDETLSFNDAC